ncbi:MAG: amidohydrolase family protein, partial [Alphaproteobacteria bacterium]
MSDEVLRRCDVLIRGGTVIDGTGARAFRADVAVAGDRVIAVGELSAVTAELAIDAAGKAVAPGFIDAHTHDDRALISGPDMAPKVTQGVTTVIAGNCGISLAPLVADRRPPPPLDLLGNEEWYRFGSFAAYVDALETAPPAVNAGLLVGHSTLRLHAMDDVGRPATSAEIAAMCAAVRDAMASGALGFSTGLTYPPNAAATTGEVVALAEMAAAAGGVYATHMRDEADRVEDALEEAFEIGRRAGLPVVISHHKVARPRNFGRSRATLRRIERARNRQPVGLDVYPYTAGSSVLLPEEVGEGVRIMVTWSEPHPDLAGRDLEEIARMWGLSRREAAWRLTPAGGIFFLMDEEDVRRILAYPHTMIGSDGLPHDAHPHPRLWGTFPRVLGHYARDLGLLALEDAVRRMTGLPAERFGLRDRGVVRAGAFADLVVFDPDRVADRATFDAPTRPASG